MPSGDITVHIVPHSHTDPGWLNTYDMYYGRDVKPILNAVVKELEASPNRTFAWCEVCFFARWYAEQSVRKRAVVQRLVAGGQLEFVGGGWVQHDEALPTVGGMLDSMAEGHAWLEETFSVRPTVGWQLDPFGHSAASAALLGRMGLHSLVVNRINYNLKTRWRSARTMEFGWAGVTPVLPWSAVLTHVLHTHYSSPKGFDFEGDRAGGRPDRAATAAEANGLRALVRQRAEAYRTRELLLLVGDDFKWLKAPSVYAAWERLIRELNARKGGGVRARFSSPATYFAALATQLPRLTPPLPTFAGECAAARTRRRTHRRGVAAAAAPAAAAACTRRPTRC
jgi:hypothetical protein